jgi:TorA-specific chaperone
LCSGALLSKTGQSGNKGEAHFITNHMTDNDKALILETIDLMSSIFWSVDAQLTETLWNGGFADFFVALNDLLDGTLGPEIDQLNGVIKTFDSADDLHSELNSTFVSLFINAREGLQVPLYQSSYLPNSSGLMGSSSLKMKELYRKQGLSLAKCHNEPADHLSIELEYLYFLLKKGWENDDESSIEEARGFISKVLNTWVTTLTQKLAKLDNSLIYTIMAKTLTMILAYLSKE